MSDKGPPVFTLQFIPDPSLALDDVRYNSGEIRCHPSVMPDIVKLIVAEGQAALNRYTRAWQIENDPLCPYCKRIKADMALRSCAVGGCPLGNDL